MQDEGRWGWQRDGVSVGGAMDTWSHRLANLLAGNAGDEATLEILMTGRRLRFDQDAVIAQTGADLPASLDGQAGRCTGASMCPPGPAARRPHPRCRRT